MTTLDAWDTVSMPKYAAELTERQRDLLIKAAKIGAQQNIWHSTEKRAIDDAIEAVASAHAIRKRETT